MKRCIIISLFTLYLTINSYTQESDLRYFSLHYFQKICLKKFNSIAVTQNQLLPVLNDNARMHGMELQGAIMKDIYIGLSAMGTLNDERNENGYTSWGGATGTFAIEYRFNLKNFYIEPGLGLGCGRFTYSTAFNDGSLSTTSHIDAIFTEPKIKLGYISMNKFIVNVEISHIISLSENEYSVGTDVSTNVFPGNLIIGLAVGYKFPFWEKKE